MSPTQRRWLVLCALACALWSPASVLAIGPDNQLIAPTFDSVVRILYNSPPNQDPGDGFMNGTGTIVGHHSKDGEGFFCVLTADHVVSATGMYGGAQVSQPGIAFGNAGDDSGNSPYFKASLVHRYGANGTTDLAVLNVKYGAYNPAYDALVRDLIPASAFFYFSVIGYGNEGQLVDGIPLDGFDSGYQSQNKYGTQRYANDKIGVFVTGGTFTAGGYTYDEAAKWYIDDPNGVEDQPGSGTTYDADSGAPYFSATPVLDGVNGFNYFTDKQFAVHTGTNLASNPMGAPAGYKAFGVENYGVALTGADIDWIEQACLMVPEPSTFVLAALVLLSMIVPAVRLKRPRTSRRG